MNVLKCYLDQELMFMESAKLVYIFNPGVVWGIFVNIPINVPNYSTFVSSAQSVLMCFFFFKELHAKNHLLKVV